MKIFIEYSVPLPITLEAVLLLGGGLQELALEFNEPVHLGLRNKLD